MTPPPPPLTRQAVDDEVEKAVLNIIGKPSRFTTEQTEAIQGVGFALNDLRNRMLTENVSTDEVATTCLLAAKRLIEYALTARAT